MTRLPRVTGQQVIAALTKAEFKMIRVQGRFHFLRH